MPGYPGLPLVVLAPAHLREGGRCSSGRPGELDRVPLVAGVGRVAEGERLPPESDDADLSATDLAVERLGGHATNLRHPHG
jgi:hypothetical protein